MLAALPTGAMTMTRALVTAAAALALSALVLPAGGASASSVAWVVSFNVPGVAVNVGAPAYWGPAWGAHRRPVGPRPWVAPYVAPFPVIAAPVAPVIAVPFVGAYATPFAAPVGMPWAAPFPVFVPRVVAVPVARHRHVVVAAPALRPPMPRPVRY
jgi:hypothetical protein